MATKRNQTTEETTDNPVQEDKDYEASLDAYEQDQKAARDGLDDDGEGDEYNERSHEELTTEQVEEMIASLDEEQRHVFQRLMLGKRKSKSENKGRKGTNAPKDEEWKPANNLQAPPARAGMAQRWVRFAIGNVNDPRNWSRSQREGWSPRSTETIPQGFNPPKMANPTGTGSVIAIGDLILCEMPIAKFISRKKYFRMKQARLLAAMQKRPLTAAEEAGDGPRIKVTNRQSVSYGRRKASSTDE